MNADRFDLTKIATGRKRLALSIMLGSLIGLFASGFYFGLFGAKMDFIQRPQALLMPFFSLSGIFGLIYLFFPTKSAVKYTAIIALLLSILYLLGKISRGEL